MKKWWWSEGAWCVAWLALSTAGAAWLAHAELERLRQDFETDARIAHRLLSQQVVQYDAILATLALLESDADATRLALSAPVTQTVIHHAKMQVVVVAAKRLSAAEKAAL